jgi:formylglycine-generating enzyme required for sulfatase activity
LVFVPAGPFLMGADDRTNNPCRTVTLDGFWIYRTPVTVAQYRKFCKATRRRMPRRPAWGCEDHPIVNVSWADAQAYCEWAGAALPTDAQWEKAARGTDGRRYPWGNEWDPGKLWCSAGAKRTSTAPVGSFPAGVSPYGCLDMAGNVSEWCADLYDTEEYAKGETRSEARPSFGESHVLRGGSWSESCGAFFRCADRLSFDPIRWRFDCGFRAVWVEEG